MEIRDYIGTIGRRLRIVVIVPLLAMAIVLLVLLARGARYESRATVIIPVTGFGSQLSLVSQAVANFEGGISSSSVVERTSADTGVAPDAVRDGLSTAQLGTSNVVEVTFTGEAGAIVEGVVEVASRHTLRLISSSGLASAQAESDLSRERLREAREELTLFLERTGLVEPRIAFTEAAKRLSRLRFDLADAEERGDEAEVESLTEQIEALSADITGLRTEWDELSNDVRRAELTADQAHAALVDAEAQSEAARQPGLVTTTSARQLPRFPYIARRVAAVGAVAAVLAAGLVIFLEAAQPLRMARRSRRELEEKERGPAARRPPERRAEPAASVPRGKRATATRPTGPKEGGVVAPQPVAGGPSPEHRRPRPRDAGTVEARRHERGGTRRRTAPDQGRIPLDPGRPSSEQDRTSPGQGRTPPDQGPTTPPDAGRTLPGPARPPDQDPTPPDRGPTPPDRGRTLTDQGSRTSPDQGSRTPPDQGPTPPDQGPTPSNRGPTPSNRGTTPSNRGPSPPDRGPIPPDGGPTPPDQGRTPADQGGAPAAPRPTGPGPSPEPRRPHPHDAEAVEARRHDRGGPKRRTPPRERGPGPSGVQPPRT
jgi:hypothetical protein